MSTTHARPASPWPVLFVVTLGLFMTLLDLTIVNIAIPRIITDLHASFDQVLWVLNAYSLLYAVLLITCGRLGDIFGPRNVFAVGVVVFTAGSALSSLAQDPTTLIAGRAVQGLGAAVLAPQGLPLLLSSFRRAGKPTGTAFAVLGMLAGLAVVAGPTLGGLLVTHLSWRWIFYLNLPIGAVVLALALVVVPDLRPGRRHRLDLGGVVLATAGLFAVVFGLIEGQRYSWGTVTGFVTIPEILGAGVLLLVAFGVSQALRQGREPLLTFAVFRDRNFSLMCGVMGALGFAMIGLFLPLTLFYQSVLGLSAQDAGLTIAVQAVAMVLASPAAGLLTDRVNPKLLLIPGLLLFAAGMAYIDWMAHADASRWSFVPGLVAAGAGLGFVWTPVFAIATRDLRSELAGIGSGIINTVQELGGVVASASVGALLSNRLAVTLPEQAAAVSGRLPASARDGFVRGFTDAARGGLEVGAGENGATVALPAGVPPSLVEQITQLAHQAFAQGFVAAMRPTLVVPIALIALVALSCFAVRRPSSEEEPAPQEEEESVA
jgi:EmrB/QacA subfamily drug resistance transporter